MYFFPKADLTLETALPQATIEQTLAENVRIIKSIFARHDFQDGSPFKGQLNGNTFTIRRSVYRQENNPNFNGEIIDETHRRIIKIKVAFHPVLLGWTLTWPLAIILLLFFRPGLQLPSTGTMAITLVCLYVCAYAYLLFLFNREMKKSTTILEDLLEAKRV